MEANEYDLVVIGSGPAGQKGAICAAKMRKKVAIIDRKKNHRRRLRAHRNHSQQNLAGSSLIFEWFSPTHVLWPRVRAQGSHRDGGPDLSRAIRHAPRGRGDQGATSPQLCNYLRRRRANSSIPHTIEVKSDDGSQLVRGHHVLIACGTRPAHSADIPIDGKRIFDSDQVHTLEEVPRDLVIVGAGIIGLEYASMFAALGVKVTLLDQRPILLDFVDREIVESLCFQLRQLGTVFRLGEKVVSIGLDEARDRVFAKLESGKNVHGQGSALHHRAPGQQRSAQSGVGGLEVGWQGQACGQ